MTAEEINALLEARIRDMAGRRHARSMAAHLQRAKEDRPKLLQGLGLDPLPPKTDLKAQITGTLAGDGYRIEKLVYESWPGWYVTAHLYLPNSSEPVPAILRPHGHWQHKKSEPVVQASAIGLALAGYAALVIDSPGRSWDDNPFNERRSQGVHDDPWLSMGTPVTGIYAWDIVRGLDYLETRPEINRRAIGITGASGGGLAATYAFAIDERIACAAPVCYPSSMEIQPTNGCLCNHVPGVMELGDRADILALRAPAPVLVVGATADPEFPPEATRRTYSKLQAIYRLFKAADRVRMEIVEGPHDYNRRMREAVLAFFDEHLRGKPQRAFRPEERPLTDGACNPAPANTLDPESPELAVLGGEPRPTLTMRDLLVQSLENPSPTSYHAEKRLAPWAKYGRLSFGSTGSVLHLDDESLPLQGLDLRPYIYLGVSFPEVFAQMLHLGLPGGIEGWEASTLGPGGEILTSVLGSVRSLMASSAPAAAVAEVKAIGPVASMVATFLKAYRPSLEIERSHVFASWMQVYETQIEALVQPGARYLGWPGQGA